MLSPKTPEELKEDLRQSLQLLQNLISYGVHGFGPLTSAHQLAQSYLDNQAYPSRAEKIQALARWEERKNFTAGYLTSLGGFFTLPLTIPASLAINWILQIRMSAAMAIIGGFDIQEPPVRTTIALSLLGKRGKELLNAEFRELEEVLRRQSLEQLPKQSLVLFNKAIIKTLVKGAANKGFTRISKAIPLAGGVLGGLLDYASCKETAEFAIELFQLNEQPDPSQNEENPEIDG